MVQLIERETIEDAMESDRCGICGSVQHFREDCRMLIDARHLHLIPKLRPGRDNQPFTWCSIKFQLAVWKHMSNTYFCSCERFKLWYIGEDIGVKVCTCGHPDTEHVDGAKMCVGEVRRVR